MRLTSRNRRILSATSVSRRPSRSGDDAMAQECLPGFRACRASGRRPGPEPHCGPNGHRTFVEQRLTLKSGALDRKSKPQLNQPCAALLPREPRVDPLLLTRRPRTDEYTLAGGWRKVVRGLIRRTGLGARSVSVSQCSRHAPSAVRLPRHEERAATLCTVARGERRKSLRQTIESAASRGRTPAWPRPGSPRRRCRP